MVVINNIHCLNRRKIEEGFSIDDVIDVMSGNGRLRLKGRRQRFWHIAPEKDVPKVEKTVDAVAEALGLTDEKQEKAFEMVGATDGAGYGDVEIYI